MKKLFLILTLIVGLLQIGMAQQQYVQTNYLLNNYYYNPAIAGSKDVQVANLSYRNQWTGFEEAPVTVMGNFYGSVKNEGKMGYGATIFTDRTGLTQTTGVYLNYAHHFKLTDKTKFGLGIEPGFLQYRVRLYDARLADQGDAVLTGNILSANAFDFNAGFHLYSDRYFIMASIQNLLGEQISFTTYNASLTKHYTLIGGYNLETKSRKFEVQPSLMLRFVSPLPAQVSMMLKTTYRQKCWIGMAWRSDDAVSVSVGYNLKERLKLGYAYDYSISGLSQYQGGSHEMVLSFVLTGNKPSLDDQDQKLNNSIMDDLKKRNEAEEKKKKN